MADSTLNPRTLTLTILIVVLFTCGMFWLNRSDIPLGYTRYENYGFSLVYPKLMYLRETGLPGIDLGSDPSDFVGLVQCQSYWDNKLDVFEIIWLVKNRASSAQSELDEFLAAISQPNSVVQGVGEHFMITPHGEEVDCTYLELEEAGNAFSGIIGVIYRSWSSPGLARVYFVAYVTLKGSATEEQVRASFQAYLGGFSIQKPE
jgi:hypothetical protein